MLSKELNMYAAYSSIEAPMNESAVFVDRNRVLQESFCTIRVGS